jgi:DNA (cytosine-5)-methyltransferase 3A
MRNNKGGIKLEVLSLFDGISCGQIALERAGIKVDKYYASEIEPNAIKVTQHNYLNTIQIGDVTKINGNEYKNVNLLIGGSPCQDFSTLNRERKGLFGEKSSLVDVYLNILEQVNPKYFLLENNVSMPQYAKDYISKRIGVEPIRINSDLVSAQMRDRYYWTNIPNVNIPQDKNIKLDDILNLQREPIELVPYVKGKLPKLIEKYGEIPKRFNPYNTMIINDKSPCLTAQGDSQTKSSTVILYDGDTYSMLTVDEWERLQTLPVGYTDCGLTTSQRKTVIGNGWTVDVISHIFANMETQMIKNAV